MKKKIIYGLLLAVAMVTASSSFVSCKDYEGDDTNRLQNEISNLEDLLEQQRIALQNCSTNCANQHALLWAEFLNYQPKGDYALKTDLNNYVTKAKFTADSTALANAIQTNAQAILNLENALKNYVTLDKFTTDSTEFMRLINENALAITSAKNLAQQAFDLATQANNLANQANELAKSDSVRIDGLEANYTTLNNNFNQFINAWGGDLAAAIAEVARVRGIADAVALDSAKWNLAAVNAQAALDSLNKYMNSWNGAVINAQAALDSLNKYMDSWNLAAINAQSAKDSLNKYQAAWNNAVILAEKANNFIGNTKFNNLQELIDAYEAADQALAGDIADLNAEVSKIKNSLAKMITGVIVQAAYSPVLGNGALPFGVQTNVLAAYVGKASADVDFPSVYDEDYADGTTVLTAADQSYLQGLGYWPATVSLTKGQYILSNREDNAGKLYLTVNPTNTDFTGTTFDMVNSAGQVSRMEISDLKPCTETLNFGWTRSGAVSSINGFYEVNAKVTEENITKLQANINTKKFEEAFKEELTANTGRGLVKYTAMMDLARAIYSSMEPMQRNGIRAQWMDETIGATRSYTSAFDIAATVVAPLGFGFSIPDGKYTRFPIFDTDYLRERFRFKADFTYSIKAMTDKATSKKILYLVIDLAFVEGSLLQESSGYYLDQAYFIGDDGFMYLDVTPLYNEIYGDLATNYAGMDALVGSLNKRVNYIVNWIDRYNYYASKADKWIARANDMLQPVLLWCDGENAGQLGGQVYANYAFGTFVPAGGAVALVPTTYTLELLAPTFKKSVVCTNVYKDGKSAQGAGAELETALKAVNKALKDGGFDLYESQSLKDAFIFEAKEDYKGMTFEFAYTALDYTGQVAGRKFYLTVDAAE
jgi:hypothetical protein